MKKHILNLYKLRNLHELDFSYKLITTDLKFNAGQEDIFSKHLRKVGEKVASIISGPVAVVRRNGIWYIAIPADRSVEEAKIDVGPFIVTIRESTGIYNIGPNEMFVDGNTAIVKNFIDFEMRRQLSYSKEIWKLTNSLYLFRKPTRSTDDSTIEVYGGFSYRLVCWNNSLYVCLNLTTKYIDKNYITRYINSKNVDVLQKKLFGRRVVYQNGDDWYAAEIQGFGNTIKDHNFIYNGEHFNVFDFITEKTKSHRFQTSQLLNEEHLALLYTYPGRSMEPHSGASSLAKLLLSPQDKQVKPLHKFSIKAPARRFDDIAKNIQQYFQNLFFNNHRIEIDNQPMEEYIANFPMPALKYSNDRILKAGHYNTGANVQVRDYAHERRQFLEDNGILNESGFDEQWLIVPDYMEKEQVEAFRKNAEHQIRKLAPKFTSFQVIRFNAKEGISATFQIQEIEKALKERNATSGFALFIIPDLGRDAKRSATTYHDCLKSKFYPALKVQCASASKIIDFFQPFESSLDKQVRDYKVPEESKPVFRSYLFYLAMEYLIMNRKWPYALAKNLNYDIYVGVDVHNRHAGFTFFFKNGEHQFFFPVGVPKKASGQRAEKLKADFLYKTIYTQLKEFIPRYAVNPNGIVLIRDGRSFGEEQKALDQIIKDLVADGLVNASTVKYGVVDLYKQSSIPFRMAVKTNSVSRLDNPIAGAFKIVNKIEGFLFNTGYPFQLRGTAKPLHLRLQSGNLEFVKVMEDVFCQSMLAFSAPDRANSLPIEIKLIDTFLKPLTATVEMVEEDEEEMDESLLD